MKKIYLIIALLFSTIKIFATMEDVVRDSLYIPDIYDVTLPTNYTQDINMSISSNSSNSEVLYRVDSNDTSVVSAHKTDNGLVIHSGNEGNKTAKVTISAVLAKRFGDFNNTAENSLKLIDDNLTVCIGGEEHSLLAESWGIDNEESNLSNILDVYLPIDTTFDNDEQNIANDYNISLKLAIYDQNGSQLIFEIKNLTLEINNNIKLKFIAGKTSISLLQTGLQRLDGILSENALYRTIVTNNIEVSGLHINLNTLKQAVSDNYNSKISNIEATLNSFYHTEGVYTVYCGLTIDNNVSLLTNMPTCLSSNDYTIYFNKDIIVGNHSSDMEPNNTNGLVVEKSFLVHVVDYNTLINPPPFPPMINAEINITQILPTTPLILKKNFGKKVIPLAVYNESNNSITINAESNDTSLLLATIDGNNLVLNSVQDRTGIADVNITAGNNSTILRVYIRDIPNTTINIPAGWSLLSFPTKGKLDAMDLYDTFGNLDIKGIVKYNGGFWSYWDSDSEVKPQYKMPKFATLSSKEGFWIKANSSCEIRYPLDANNNDPQDILRFQYYKNGWFLIGVNEDMTPSSLATLIEQKSGKSVYLIYVYRNGEWKIYTPDSELDSRIRSDIPRIDGNVLAKEGIWVLLR